MKKLFAILSLVGLLFTFSCEDPSEDIYSDVDKRKGEVLSGDGDFDARSGL